MTLQKCEPNALETSTVGSRLVLLSNFLVLILILVCFIGENEANDFSSAYSSLFADQTCSSASQPSLSWSFKQFGNASFPQVVQKISEWQLAPDSRILIAAASDLRSTSCIFGICDPLNSSCKCARNWVGSRCQNCAGRTLWSHEQGIITSNTPGTYQENSRCTWIITPPQHIIAAKPSLQLKLTNFSTECSWDLLFVFDGTTAISSHLLAVISGDLSGDQLASFPIIYSKLGSLLVYFYSDAYLNYGGFTLEYSFSYCPRNCSGHGECLGGQASTQSYTMTYSAGSSSSSSSSGTSGESTTSTTTISGPYFATPLPFSASARCVCEPGYRGDSCEFLQCPNDCSSGNGSCQADGTCRCKRGFVGLDCSIDALRQSSSSGYWNILSVQSPPLEGGESYYANKAPASGGAAVLVGDTVWLFGGFDFPTRFNTLSLRTFDLTLQSFNDNISTGNSIFNRYGHSAALSHKDPSVVYLFGGTLTWSNRITSELVLFNLATLNFTTLSGFRTQSNPPNKQLPAALTGHTAHLITSNDGYTEQLLIFFGYSPDYGLSDWLRIYDFNSSSWSVVQSPFAGRAWHTSVYDEDLNSVFVFGGFAAAHRKSSVDITGDLIRFDVANFGWSYVAALPHRRAFHSAVLLPTPNRHHMLIHGGTMHETTASSRKTHPEAGLCTVTRPFVLDLASGCLSTVNDALSTHALPSSFSRISHSPVIWDDSVLYFGGFDGTVIDNRLLQYIPMVCESRTTIEDCLIPNGFTCQWACDGCLPASISVEPYCNSSQVNSCKNRVNMTASSNFSNNGNDCSEKTSCASCIIFQPGGSDSCQWLAGEICISNVRSQTQNSVITTTQDSISDSPSSASSIIQLQSLIRDADQCPTSCYALSDCYSCTKQSACLWCNTLGLCVPSDAYRIAFPYGQCQDWTMAPESCRTNCSSYHSCADCQQDLRCGWCDDGSGTGTGSCMIGGLTDALNASSLNAPGCPSERWYFSKCPKCQCSGHSTCFNDTEQCQACRDNTEGDTCDRCTSGYYGSALNGGTCQHCQCNGHATFCDNLTGVCKCDTQGISGSHCDVCDRTYEGDAALGTCYYPIQAGYRYTMDLTKKDMIFINKISFQTKDKLGRNEVNFKLNCSRSANYVLTYVTGVAVNSSETLLQSGLCGPDFPPIEISVSPSGGVPFAEPNFRFRIGISNFTHPFLVTLVATEEQPFLIYLLLIAVFGCFLVVLVIAIIVFQIKRRYDEYHRRQQVKIELRRMAKRPFAMVNFLIVPSASMSGQQMMAGNSYSVWETPLSESIGSRTTLMKMAPTFQPRAPPMPVILQPLAQPGAAIMTVLVQLPLVAYSPSSNSSGSESSDATLSSPSALAAGSVIVRAASNLLSDLSNRGRQQSPQQSTPMATSETTLCAGSSNINTSNSAASRAVNSGVEMVNETAVSPVTAPASRRSSRQTCWNTPPGSINSRPPGFRIGSASHHQAPPDIMTPTPTTATTSTGASNTRSNSTGAPSHQAESSLSVDSRAVTGTQEPESQDTSF